MTNTDTTPTTTEELADYATSFGPAYWPGAYYFLLVGVRDGQLTGSGAEICRSCVGLVARNVLAFLGGAPAGGALRVCGAEPGYDILGVTDAPADEGACCAECGDLL